MPAASLHRLDTPGVAEEFELPAHKRISGNPLQKVWTQYADPSGQFVVGVWHSDVGKWRVAYTEEEFCLMLEGTSVVTDGDGRAFTVTAGDSFVMPRGFTGTWEVVVPTTKRFVVYEARA